jgi:hypothetical protein
MTSPFGAHSARNFASGCRKYSSQLTKLGITSMGRLMSNSLSVRSSRYREIDVTPSLCSMEYRVMGRKLRLLPTSVMSVPCSVVINGSRRGAAIERASKALTECGIA